MKNAVETPHGWQTLALRHAVLLLWSAAVTACTAGAGGVPVPVPVQEEPTLQRIGALIGAATCHTDAQCAVAAIGHRSCGGPESFRAWSTRDTQPAALHSALQAHAQARQRQQEKTGEMSTCNVLPVPAAACMPPAAGTGPGRCVLSANPGLR